MFKSMRHQITDHVNEVRGYIGDLSHRDPTTRAQAAANLARYVNVKRVNGTWRVQGPAFDGAVTVDEPLRVPRISELPGLHHFLDGKLWVRRPIESE